MCDSYISGLQTAVTRPKQALGSMNSACPFYSDLQKLQRSKRNATEEKKDTPQLFHTVGFAYLLPKCHEDSVVLNLTSVGINLIMHSYIDIECYF